MELLCKSIEEEDCPNTYVAILTNIQKLHFFDKSVYRLGPSCSAIPTYLLKSSLWVQINFVPKSSLLVPMHVYLAPSVPLQVRYTLVWQQKT